MKENVAKRVLEANGFSDFNEMQRKCIKKGFEKNMVVSEPTASGKTIIAEIFMLEQAFNNRKKVIYTCPLRALASEHYSDFKKKFPELKFALSTGDLDSSSSYLKKFDVIFTTYEKLNSLIRHDADWLKETGCLIVDEIHEIDSDRGPVLEITITQMRQLIPNIKILALSATIPNSKEISEWLSAELVESDFRPVKLREGVGYNALVEFNDESVEEGDFEKIVDDALVQGKQILIFMNARKRTEATAKKLSELVSKKLCEKEKPKLEKISLEAVSFLEQPTEQCISLGEVVKNGIAFHHAGLIQKQRSLVEENFRNGLIKIIVATTTLSAGVNVPADIVIIPSLYRFEKYSMKLIPVREFKQMSGRSGRPKFSKEGKSIVFANSETQKDLYMEDYINGSPEPVNSQLGIVPILRTHILGLVAIRYVYDLKSAETFFSKTFYAKQFGEMPELLEKIMEIINNLEEFGFVKKSGSMNPMLARYEPTKLGKRVSDLFLDPESAYSLIQALRVKKTFTPFSYLFAWANCMEFSPWLNTPKKIEPIISEEINSRFLEVPFSQEKLLFEPESTNKFFSAMMLEQWVEEKREQELFEKYGVLPGTLFGKTRIVEWLAYSTIELSKVLGLEHHLIPAKRLSDRAKYGVKEELLSLVQLKGVGRVRARRLFNVGITKPSEIKKNLSKVEGMFGKAVSLQLAKQLSA
jgi:helicase